NAQRAAGGERPREGHRRAARAAGRSAVQTKMPTQVDTQGRVPRRPADQDSQDRGYSASTKDGGTDLTLELTVCRIVRRDYQMRDKPPALLEAGRIRSGV